MTDSVQTPNARQETIALSGGRPVRSAYLPYGHHEIDEADIQAVVGVLQSDWITTGPKVPEFEHAVAQYVGAPYAVAFSSGTAALHAAVFAAGLGPGDEAVTTPLTFCATANCILYQGAAVALADVAADTLNIDPEQVARRITPRTRAILPMDYGGHPADLDALVELAERRGLVMIEDACHALGATYRGRKIGSVSQMSVFSFHPVKHVTTGEGGMVTTNSAEFARRLRLFRTHGIDYTPALGEATGPWYYEVVALGYNYRIPDIGCALGLSQLRRLDANLARRRAIADRYTAALRDVPGVLVPTIRPDVEPAWHLYAIRLELEALSADRAAVFRALRAENIGVQVHYIPVHLHPYYRQRFGYRGGEYPIAEDAYERLISLPVFAGMSDADLADVIRAVKKVLAHYGR